MASEKPVKPFTPGQEKFGEWFIKRIGSMQVWVYEKTNGRLWNTFLGGQVAILTTLGRKSGEPRKTPLLYIEDGNRVVMVGSKGGMSKPPLWFLNLQANPEAQVQVRARKRTMISRVATPEEEATLWPKLDAMYAGYAEYRARCEGVRKIPVIIFDEKK